MGNHEDTPMFKNLLAWFDARLHVRATLMPMLLHPIPKGAAGPMGWWYVFGSASMTLLMVQIVTGIGLAGLTSCKIASALS